ncbi:amidohydrolase [Altererythrobacter sp. ZODW24]|uniref:amidohydrolase n=1 Tax=Altererythrobacter sp. ZODW24 TaxID=2185142 RepID=UPI000DF72135|nr:amidohydrolase [Altererythrobacter sp. ZODW24]
MTAAAALAAVLTSPALADTLIDNVNGITIDEDGKVDRFTALVIGDDGRITKVIHRGDKAPKDVDYRIDGEGRVMLPGMIDGHAHMMGIGFGALTLDLAGTKSLAEAQTLIAEYAAENPNLPWIIGRGWNQEIWGLGRFPTAAEIDSVVADRPVWLYRVDGHAGWGNTLALKAGNVVAASKDPVGGRIERLAGSQNPSGVLVDTAQSMIDSKLPAPRPEDYDLALGKAQQSMLKNGVTAISDMGTSIRDWQAFRRAGDTNRLRVRILSYAGGTQDMELIGGPGPSAWLYDDRLRLNGVKLYIDGALGSRGATLKADYHDAPGQRGLAITGPVQLRNLMSRAAIDKFQVAVHAIGDAANADLLDAIDEMAETYDGDRRWRIEHAQIVSPSDIAKFGQHGIVASMQPVHQTSDRTMAEARLGPDRLDGAYAWQAIADTGAVLAFGTDAPVEALPPFVGLAAAITRTDANGEPFGGWFPNEAVSRAEALAAYTAGAAYAGFADGKFGRLVEGEWADFIFVDRDPLMVSPSELRQTEILETWVAGRREYAAKPEQSSGPGR